MLMPILLAVVQTSPVPEVVLSRMEAESLSPGELEARLLAELPHGRILSARVTPSVPVTDPPTQLALDSAIFQEAGRPLRGEMCTARRIVAKFDTLDGKLSADGNADQMQVRRRLFSVTPYPLMAVVDGPATTARCEAVTDFAQLPVRAPEMGIAAIERLSNETRRMAGGGKPTFSIVCVEEKAGTETPCDGAEILAKLDWSALSSVELSAAGTRMRFGGRDSIALDIVADRRIRSVAIRRGPPPPF